LKFVLTALLGLLLQAANPAFPTPSEQYFRYHRTVVPVGDRGQACSVIEPGIFPKAAPSLKDLRLYQDGREVPYAITLSQPEQPDSDAARVLNLGMRGDTIVFDLEMPARRYTDVALDLAARNYLATAVVSGMSQPGAPPTSLGEFTLFDLSEQHLSHNTTLHLQESSFPFLHVAITASPAPASPAPGSHDFVASPQIITGATVPPSREAQVIFTTALSITAIEQRGNQTIAIATLPPQLPIERVTFVLAPSYTGNFSRDVFISAKPTGESNTTQAAPESATGTIQRVHLTQAGREIRQQQLSIPAILGANLQQNATLEVAVNNGNDAPLPITAVLLEMREHEICFDASTASRPELFYGDPALPTPQYDFARLFSPSARLVQAQLGPEQPNPGYHPRPDTRSITERHPDFIWIVLLIVISILAIVAMRSTKALPR